MAEERIYQGHVYRRNSANEPWVIAGPAAGGGTIIGDPYKARDEARKEEDQERERERLRLAQQAAALAAENAKKPPEGYEAGPEGLRIIPGGPADPAVLATRAAAVAAATKPKGADITPEERGKALTQYNSLPNLIDGVNDLRKQYDKSFKGWNPLEGAGAGEIWGIPVGKLVPGGEKDRIFNDTSNSLTAYIATALGLSGQQFNTPAEQKLFIEGILPKAGDTDGQIQAKLDRLDRLIGNARDKGKATLGYSNENDPLAGTAGLAEFSKRTAVIDGGAPPPTAAPPGSTEAQRPVPPEMQAENSAWLAEHAQNLDSGQYVQFRQALDAKYGFTPASEADLRTWADGVRERQKKGVPLRSTAIPAPTESLSGLDQARNNLVQNDIGAFLASMGNAGGLGIPGLFAGDQLDALRQANPTSTTLGEVVGTVTGTAGVAKGLGVGASKIANPTVARLLANPLTADVAYGATYGATQDDNPLEGALVGGGLSLGGSLIGSQIGKRLPGAFGLRKPVDPLAAGERNVLDAVDRTGQDSVVSALREAEALRVPAGLADVSSDVNSLTGAALRRSPAAAGTAREALAQRGRGQFDRFRGAVERDLGPIENVPERGDNLIARARRESAPLYDKAYAAPIPEDLDMSDLLTRPSMQRALKNARRIAMEEGRNPDELGFVINDAGNVSISDAGRFVEARGPKPRHELGVISGPGKGAPRDLVSFVRERGGLRDQAGELKFMGADNKGRTGTAFASGDTRAGPLVNNEGGANFDDMAEAAWEAGYFGPPSEIPRPTTREFLEALQDTHTGVDRRFSTYDDDLVQAYKESQANRYEWEKDAGDLVDRSEPAGQFDVPFAPPEALGSYQGVQPSWQTLDYVKRGMDDVIETYRDKTTGRLVLDTEGYAMNDTLRQFIARADAANPDYAAARAAYSGPAVERKAMLDGQRAVSMSPDQIDVNLGHASDSQREQMRLGFQSQLAENAGKLRLNSNPFEAVVGTPNMEQRLSSLYDDPHGVARFLAQRDLEGKVASSTNRLVGNSMSAERIAADQAFGENGKVSLAIDAATAVAGGVPVATAMRKGAVQNLADGFRLGFGQKGVERADQIAALALETDPSKAIAQLLALSQKSDDYRVVLDALIKSKAAIGGHAGAGMAVGAGTAAMRD